MVYGSGGRSNRIPWDLKTMFGDDFFVFEKIFKYMYAKFIIQEFQILRKDARSPCATEKYIDGVVAVSALQFDFVSSHISFIYREHVW